MRSGTRFTLVPLKAGVHVYFAVVCIDKKDAGDLRARTRPSHLTYIEGFREAILFAGPFLEPGTDRSVGGLIVIDLPDHDDALSFAQHDPYALAGLFERVDVRPWRKVIPS